MTRHLGTVAIPDPTVEDSHSVLMAPSVTHTTPMHTQLPEATALTQRTDTVHGQRLAGRSAIRSAMRRSLSNTRWSSRAGRGRSLCRALTRGGGSGTPSE